MTKRPAFPAGSGSPFVLVPWDVDFLEALAARLAREHNGDMSNMLLVFPNERPPRYLRPLLQAHPMIRKPCILPRMMPANAFLGMLLADCEPEPRRILSRLDQAALLRDAATSVLCHDEPDQMPAWAAPRQTAASCSEADIAHDTAKSAPSAPRTSFEALPLRDLHRFLPWGLRLAALMEDFFMAGLAPDNYQNMEGLVDVFAGQLLRRLADIHALYLQKLDAMNATTQGYDALRLKLATEQKVQFPSLRSCRVILAGFHALAGTEDALFRYLWTQYGATIFLHTDPDLASGREAHWAAREHENWIRAWGARPELAQPARNKRPRILLYEGYDLHSQLGMLEKELLHSASGAQPPASSAAAGTSCASDMPSSPDTSSAADMPSSPDTPSAADTSCGPDTSSSSDTSSASGTSCAPDTSSTPGTSCDADIFPAPVPDAVPSSVFSAAQAAGKNPLPAGSATPEEGTVFRVPDAVILPDAGLLLPVLHHLPQKDVNISMGYPMERSPLARLLEVVLELQENRTDKGFHWRGILELLRHPYLRMLGGPARPLQAFFTALDNSIREQNIPFPDPRTLMPSHDAVPDAAGTAFLDISVPDEALALARRVFALTLDNFSAPPDLGAVADALQALALFLISEGGGLWRHFPLDAECLFRLTHHVVPALKGSLLADEALPLRALFAVVREVIHAERVPFEAEPLTGLQVLGMLETRLLRFRHVFILDAVESSLPGTAGHDPLLPDSLRAELGLPDIRTREQAMAHTFHRLIRSAETVTVFYQTSQGGSELLDARNQRSRFVEELIWEEEKRRTALIRPQAKGFLRPIIPCARPISVREHVIWKSPVQNEALMRFLSRPIACTALDTYLHCPAAFFLGCVLRLKPPEEISEGNDPAAVGELLHATLQNFFEPLLDTPLPAGLPDPGERMRLRETFFTELGKSGLVESLPYHSLFMLREGAPRRLMRMLDAMPDTRVISLEKTLTVQVRPAKSPRIRQIQGRLDRIDRRGEGYCVLDYKTGNAYRTPPPFWAEDNPLWERMRAWSEDEPDRDPELLADLAAAVQSLQLPTYACLLMQGTGPAVHEAAFVHLGNDGAELPLLGPGFSDDERERILAEAIPELLEFLLRHMEHSRNFPPQRSIKCNWCSWRKTCIV